MNLSHKEQGLPTLPIAIEAMGGDYGPRVIVEGAVKAWKQDRIRSILVGNSSEIENLLNSFLGSEKSTFGISVCHAEEVISMEDSASAPIRKKVDSSMRKAFKLVVDKKASCVLGPGNTGAMMATGIYEFGVVDGVSRPAIGTTIPRNNSKIPTILLDSGANVDCTPEQLLQFGIMGSIYATELFSCSKPRIGILSNGSESSKGNDCIRTAYKLLVSEANLNFIGYVEGNDLGKDSVDVVVCDGLVGNVALKSMEGAVKLVVNSLREFSQQAAFTSKLGMWLAKPLLQKVFKEKLNPSYYGGAPLLGLKELVIITHGSSDFLAIYNALVMSASLLKANLCSKIEQALNF
jgi:phosphate acyltransferase